MIDRALDRKRNGSVAIVRLGGPDSVYLTSELSCELDEVWSEITWDEQLRVVLLVFNGKVTLPVDEKEGEYPDVDPSMIVASVASLELPVIGAIKGDALGLGLELAMACDVRVGTEGALFGLSQIQEGRLPCAGGTQRLPRLIGRGKALEMVLTGEPIDAREATRRGLINRIVPGDQLETAAMSMAVEMAEKSPLAMNYAKEALYNGMDLTLDQGLRMELDLYLLLFTTQDRVEGVTAFKGRRKPVFEGK
jgi:enoyl-CoA hydratase